MSRDLVKSAAWWATTRGRARWTIVGAIVLISALAVTTVLVWASPQTSPITSLTTAGEQLTALDRVQQDRDRLQRQVDDLRAQIDSKNGKLVSQSSALGHANSRLAQVQQQLEALKNAAAARPVSPVKKPSAGTTSGPGTPTPLTVPSKAELLDPASPYFGIYTEQAPFNWATYDQVTAKIGAQPTIVGYFQGWDQAFRGDAVTRAWQHGQLPLMTWESRPIDAQNDVVSEPEYALPRILAGEFDAYLHQFAHDVAATGLPLGIRLDQEMNGIWYPWSETDGSGASLNGNAAGQFAQMWRHVHDVFEQEGANDQVIWLWSPNRVDNLPPSLATTKHTASLYPGDAYVDWVGMSAYLRPPFRPGEKLGFDDTFAATLAQLRAIARKPILLSEIGASETEGHKPAWITSFFEGLNDPANADIIGFAWFDQAVTSYVEGVRQTNDWRIDSRADSLAAFVAGLTAPGGRFRLEPAP